jgi:pimeloyl-ACP methyl ester carboxylesterase
MIIAYYLNIIHKISPKLAAKYIIRLFSKPFSPKKKPTLNSIFETAIHSYITYQNKKVVCYKWGNGNNAILVIHGWGGRASNFEKMISTLVQQGRTVYAFDAPAHGNSEGTHTNVLEFKNIIIELIRKNKEIKNSIGHSLGGVSAVLAFKELENEQHRYNLILISSPADLAYVLNTFINFLKLPPKAFTNCLQYITNKYGLNLIQSSLMNINQPKNVATVTIIHDKGDKIVSVADSEKVITNWNIDPKNVLITNSLGHYKILADTAVIKHIQETVS